MEAATSTPAARRAGRDLSGEKAQRIVDAMRRSVARRGAAGSTFDHVAREAGVSRGLLHYYFGTKERLLIEVVRRDCEIRMRLLDESLAGARTADDFVDVLVRSLDDLVRNSPEIVVLIFELFVLARQNEEINSEVREMFRLTHAQVADLLRAKEQDGVLDLAASPDATAQAIFALGDGAAMRMLTEPERDFSELVQAGIVCARALLTGGR